MNLEELKTLNIKDIGGWPILPKMAVLLALLLAAIFAAYWLDWNAQLEQLENVQAGRSQTSRGISGQKEAGDKP